MSHPRPAPLVPVLAFVLGVSTLPLRRLLALLVIPAAAWIAGCSDDEEPTEYTHAGSYAITGFYISPFEGGHMSARVDRWTAKGGAAPAASLRPSESLPLGLRVTLTPDDGSAPIELVGYGNTTTASGGGYQVSQGSFSDGRFFGYLSSPKGSGYCMGMAGTPDSIEVYLGTFSGDTLKGRWSLVAPDTAEHHPFPSATSFKGMAYDSANVFGTISLNGYYQPFDTAYQVWLDGFGPGTQGSNWSGSGTLTGDKSFASGTSAVGAWSATRYVPPAP